MADVLRPLLARVKTETGLTVVHRGEELPDDLAEGEAERLTELEAVGEPFKTADEVADAELAEERSTFEADVEAEAGASETTKPSAELGANPSDEDIDAFVADATAAEIVSAAGDDPDLAAKLVDAETTLHGDDARKSVVALTDEG